jgi:hypothetical protein
MQLRSGSPLGTDRFGGAHAMRDELTYALREALFELDVLPSDEDAALVGLYAVMDDLQEALHRAQALDLVCTA